MDSRSLNLATTKDDYVMLIAYMLVNAVANNEILTFMDSYSGYNQTYFVEEDIHKIMFHCLG